MRILLLIIMIICMMLLVLFVGAVLAICLAAAVLDAMGDDHAE